MTVDPTQFRIPAVRHLAWMSQAPQLHCGDLSFDPARLMGPEGWTRLRAWDARPEQGPPVLTEPAHRRLGLYFESLYHCLLTEVLGWELLARNLPIRNSERTLGELDFLLRNPHSGDVEHHEVAVKFYLGYKDAVGVRWYGPNARDRLDIKTARLREHQSRLTRLPEARPLLRRLGVHEVPRPRIFMPGYLFYPRQSELPPPDQVPRDHGRGGWLYVKDADALDVDSWANLLKPHWLGPWIQKEPPDRAETIKALQAVAETGRPRLFARLEYRPGAACWTEKERAFIVPASWPLAAS